MAKCKNRFSSQAGFCHTFMDIASLAAEAFIGQHRNWFRSGSWPSNKELGMAEPLGKWASHISEMHTYDSQLFLKRGAIARLTRFQRGSVHIPYFADAADKETTRAGN
mmetsp:Transcript_15704/g.36364  ORF Transcript_15704/g.36364 Transcript_15704/m.36364 type:complete len:108 (-) Transcript_15704:260-583(-)